MHHYPHHIADFNQSTRHLTRIERSVYRDLLDLYYDTETKLTPDIGELCRKVLARTDEEVTAVEQVLNEFFILSSQGWGHVRCELEIAKYKTNKSAKSVAGKASAAKRKALKDSLQSHSPAAVEQPLNSSGTDEQLTKNLKPRTINNSPKNKFSDDDMKCAEYIAKGVAEVSPSLKPNLNKWADVIRLIRERDGHVHKEICDMFKWAHADEFWKANILSPDKLRKQWPTLEAKRNHGGGPQNKPEWAKIPMDDEEMVKWAVRWKYPKAAAHDNYNQYRGKLRALVQARLDKGEG